MSEIMGITDDGEYILYDGCLYRKVSSKVKTPTDLTNKCGNCRWASYRSAGLINCECPNKKPNFFSRTRPKCSFYEVKENGDD